MSAGVKKTNGSCAIVIINPAAADHHNCRSFAWITIQLGHTISLDKNLDWTKIQIGEQFCLNKNLAWTKIQTGQKLAYTKMDKNLDLTKILLGQNFSLDKNLDWAKISLHTTIQIGQKQKFRLDKNCCNATTVLCSPLTLHWPQMLRSRRTRNMHSFQTIG